MKKTLLLLILLLFSIQEIFARQLTSSEAQAIATSFYKSKQAVSTRVAVSSAASSAELKLAYTCTESILKTRSSGSSATAYYYIFNVGTNGGFVIVSGDDRAKPILGYTDSGSFPADNLPDNFRNWMSFYQKELTALAAIAEDTTTTSTSNVSVTTKTSSFATYINSSLRNYSLGSRYSIQDPLS